MAKKTIKTEKVLAAWNVLSQAKYTKLEDGDKVKVWKISRRLKPVATGFDEDSKDAAEKMKPSEDFADRLQKAQQYEMEIRKPGFDAEKDTLPMGAAEYGEFLKEWKKYNELVNKAVKEFADKEVELDFDTLSEEAFGKLMSSNEWTMAQVDALAEVIVE